MICFVQLFRKTNVSLSLTHTHKYKSRQGFIQKQNFGGEAASSANSGIVAIYLCLIISVDSSNSSEFKGLSESHGEK